MIFACSKCGQKNRVPANKLSDLPKCGACHTQLKGSQAPVEVTGDEFDDVVANSSIPVIVDFWASWCGPCRMAVPELVKLAKAQSDKVLVVKINTDQYPEVSARQNVRGIPLFKKFSGGKEVKSQAGYMTQSQLEQVFGL